MEVAAMVSQSTLTTGDWKAEAIALLSSLPTELPEGFKEDRAWYHARIREILRTDRHSETARQLEAVMTGAAPQVQHIETRNPHVTEKVTPSFFYPKGYKPNSVEEQVKRLLAVYDWLDASHVDILAQSWDKSLQADGLYVVPKPTVLAEKLGIEDVWTNFGVLTEKGPLAALSFQRKFYNFWVVKMDAQQYRLADSAKVALQQLEAEQPGDLLVFPAQTGKLYAGFSPRNARWEAENNDQWPLPAYIVGWILFCNPQRLQKYEHLLIDCPGDEYRFDDGQEFDLTLYFHFGDGGLCLSDGWSGSPSGSCGGASGFFQQ